MPEATKAASTTDLRSILFDEIRSLRSGDSNSQQAVAVSKLATNIINTAMLDLAAARIAERAVDEPPKQLASNIVPMALTTNQSA